MDQRWNIELFGWLRATRGDQVVARFRTHRAAALLAYLAYHGDRSHPRDVLVELLWPESEPHAGRTGLRTELTSLRHQLEPPGIPPGAVLVTDRTTVRLNPAACVIDVEQFKAALTAAQRAPHPGERVQQLTTAAELYRGALLPGYFEEWVLPERQWLAETFFQALHELVGLLEEGNNLPAAVQWARRAVAADPLGEESHHQLIRLLLASGQVEAARAQFEQGEHRLLQELGSGLSPDIRALIRDLAPIKDRPPTGPARERRRKRRLVPPTLTPEPLPSGPASHLLIDPTAGSAPPSQPPGTAVPPSDNLPLRFTRFFGREEEIARLSSLLPQPCRLVTLTGPGGTGKTRLALQVAQQFCGAYPGGVWFVSLRDLTDPALIADQILLSLRQPRNPQVEPLAQVVAFFSRAAALLLLDNLEHLVDGGAEIVQELLERVELLTVLATSRQRLALEGEREFPVAPLPVPGDRRQTTGDRKGPTGESDPSSVVWRLSSVPSVVLFVDRAQSARPDFQLTPHNAAAVAGLCQRLEGLPLAIELAAARSGVLTPQQMLSHLEQQEGARWGMLVGRQRSADPRHRSLRATLDWSYQLLTPELQRFFARLSIFRGGWTLEAAEAVCGEAGRAECGPDPRQPTFNTLEYLEQLRECSLVQAAETTSGTTGCSEGVIRFHLLETLREFGVEQLAQADRSALARRHAQFFLALVETAGPHLAEAGAGLRLDQLEREHDNLRAALAWAGREGAPSDDVQLGLRLGGTLVHFWLTRGYQREGQDQLLRLLARPGAAPPTSARARALQGAGRVCHFYGDLSRARALLEESLTISRALDNPVEIAEALQVLGFLAHVQEDRTTGRALLEESLAIRRERGDQSGIASALNTMAWTAHQEGDLPAARALAEESLAIQRETGHLSGIADSLELLGNLAHMQWDPTTARALFEEALVIRRELSNRGGVAIMLNSLGLVATTEGDQEAARALLQESLAVAGKLDDPAAIAGALRNLAGLAHHQRDRGTGRVLLEECLAIYRQQGDRIGTASALNCLAGIARQEWDIPAARALAGQSLAIRRELGDPREIAGSLFTMGWISAEEGDRTAARALHEEGLAILRELDDRPRMLPALDSVGCLALCQGDLEAARALFQEYEAKATERNDKSDLARAVAQMGRMAEAEEDYPAAGVLFEQALTRFRELDERSRLMGTLFLQGWSLRQQGDNSGASAAFSELFDLSREQQWSGSVVTPLCLLGEVAGDRGDWEQAAAHLAEGLRRCRAGEGRHPQAVPQCLSGMARVALARERPARAARLLGAAAALWTEAGPSAWEIEPRARRDRDRNIAATRAQLEEGAFVAAWAEGQALPVEQAIAEALLEVPSG